MSSRAGRIGGRSTKWQLLDERLQRLMGRMQDSYLEIQTHENKVGFQSLRDSLRVIVNFSDVDCCRNALGSASN
jgi:hypothetical protein